MGSGATRPPFEVLEHTADIGLRAWAETREALFENCALGLAEILDRSWDGSNRSNRRRRDAVLLEAAASDVDALLVEWMNEVMFTLEITDGCLAAVDVAQMTATRLRGSVMFAPCGHEPEGTELKAATYHQLSVRETPIGWEATVYFDV